MKILAPTDGSDISKRAIEYVLNLAKKHSSMQVTLLSVSCIDLSAPFGKEHIMNPIEFFEFYREHYKDSLDEARSMFEAHNIAIETLLIPGDPAEVIIEMAKNNSFDKVVMGTRGLSNLKGWVLGSVSAKVISNLDIPVTLIK